MANGLTILIIDNGARGHALSNAYERSSNVSKIIVAPGNDFIGYARQKEVHIAKSCSLGNVESLLNIARKYKPDIIDVAEDKALAAGAVDVLEDEGFVVFGPRKAAARIEWDKRWSREFMQRHSVPHPKFRYHDNELDAIGYAEEVYAHEPSKIMYVKASGLCDGKGALKSASLEEAIANIREMKYFPNDAGKIFLIEEGLDGEEFSYYVASDGKTFKAFPSAQDNKTRDAFDCGPQTGGMGAVSPARVTAPLEKEIREKLIDKALKGMSAEGLPYKGILYLGGINVLGKPMNIEYNARWGDPECQVVLPSLVTNYLALVESCINGKLAQAPFQCDKKMRACVVGASRGYPEDYSSVIGKRIYGLAELADEQDIAVLGAGIAIEDGKFYASGGRLFSIVAEGEDIVEATDKAYAAISRVSVEGNNLHFRNDIGWRDRERYWKERSF